MSALMQRIGAVIVAVTLTSGVLQNGFTRPLTVAEVRPPRARHVAHRSNAVWIPGAVWVPGDWSWRNDWWSWIPGHWEVSPATG